MRKRDFIFWFAIWYLISIFVVFIILSFLVPVVITAFVTLASVGVGLVATLLGVIGYSVGQTIKYGPVQQEDGIKKAGPTTQEDGSKK